MQGASPAATMFSRSTISPLADVERDLRSAAPRGSSTEHLAVRSDGFEKTELDFVCSITAPLFWAFRDSTGHEDHVKSGSVFFLDTGDGTFAVTAAHVVEECLKDSEYPVFQCMIGGNGPGRTVYLQRKNDKRSSINRLCDRIIAIHHGIDIATLRVSRNEVELTGCTFLISIERPWPPRLAEVGAVAYCGCTGEARWRLAPHELSFGYVAMGGVATSVHESCISIQIEKRNSSGTATYLKTMTSGA